jgi:starch-binding outer membrane protein, SusD/RagB family
MKAPYKILLIASLSLFLFVGCEDWLDVSPKSSLKQEDMLSTQTGYIDVLHGVYIGLLDNGLYGRELTFGMLDAMAQYYTNIPATPLHRYRHARVYNYEATTVKPIIDNIWRKMYNNIANCNIILDNIDKDPDIFTGNNYARIKGEALALRAFMHYELLRLFAPAYSQDTRSQPAIPYVDTFTNIRIPFSTMDQVYQRIEQDLHAARNLLRDFDLMGPNSTASGVGATQARKALMNYYASTYLLAQINLNKGNNAQVLEYFEELNTEQAQLQIYWGQLTQFYAFVANEWVFNMHIVIAFIREKYTQFFELATANQNDLLTVSLPRVFEIYEVDEGGASDIRYLEWMSKNDDNEFIKYYLIAGFPLMKKGELFLMAAEAAKDSDPEAALGYINELRMARNLTPLDETADIMQAIYKESMKEFVGEGKMWHFYKRHGFEFIPGYGSAITPEMYVFPIPESEYEFNPIQ